MNLAGSAAPRDPGPGSNDLISMCRSNVAMSTTLINQPWPLGRVHLSIWVCLNYRVPQNPMVCWYVYLVQSNLKFWGRPPFNKIQLSCEVGYMMLYDVICISCISHNFCPHYSWIVCWLVHPYSPWESSRACRACRAPSAARRISLRKQRRTLGEPSVGRCFFSGFSKKATVAVARKILWWKMMIPMVDMCCLMTIIFQIDIQMFFWGACTAVLFLDGPAMKRWEPQEFLRFRAAIHASGRRNLGWGHGTLTSKSIKIGFGRTCAGWWFGTFFIFPNSWDDDPIWVIFFRGVEATNQVAIGSGYGSVPSTSHWRFDHQ